MRLVGYAFTGGEPEVMGYGPVPATERALARTGLSIDDIGLFEINEAFAVQVLSFLDAGLVPAHPALAASLGSHPAPGATRVHA